MKIMKLLIIEDDAEIRNYVAKGLREHGHTADMAPDGKEGLFLATTESYDVLIVDRMLPELDGLKLIKTLRGSDNITPVLILSALGDVDHRVEGLRAGGDDYLTKPFAFSELLARVEVLGRRSGQGDGVVTKFTIRDCEVDLLGRKVARGGTPIKLMNKEFSLLECLLKHRGQVVTRTMLLESLWDYHFDPQTNVIDVHISRLRKKLDAEYEFKIIQTVRGSGYIIE